MPSIGTIVDALQHDSNETAMEHARRSGFCQRASKLDTATFCRGLILGWLERPEASLAQLAQMLATCGVSLSPQGLDQRFGPAAARLLQQVLEAVAQRGMPATAPVPLPLLQCFTAVELDDSSIVSLPATLASLWKGSGGSRGGEAAVKLQVRLELLWGTLLGPFLQDGKGPDKDAPMHACAIAPGSLRIADSSYFSLGSLRRRSEAQAFWLSRYHPQTSVYLANGTSCRPLELAAQLATAGDEPVDWAVRLGKQERLPCRLLAIRVPEEVAEARRERLRISLAAAADRGNSHPLPVHGRRLPARSPAPPSQYLPNPASSLPGGLSLMRTGPPPWLPSGRPAPARPDTSSGARPYEAWAVSVSLRHPRSLPRG